MNLVAIHEQMEITNTDYVSHLCVYSATAQRFRRSLLPGIPFANQPSGVPTDGDGNARVVGSTLAALK